MVEVFKTNINKIKPSKALIRKLLSHYPGSSFHIDINDCDRVLRVEGEDFCPVQIIKLVTSDGYECEVLN